MNLVKKSHRFESIDTAIFDLDGTLSNNSHRLYLIKQSPPDWDNYTKQCILDTPILPLINIYQQLERDGKHMIILSGRCDSMRQQTESWLEVAGVKNYAELLMRPQGDYTADVTLKQNWVEKTLGLNPATTVAYDDLDHNCEMFSGLGMLTYKVGAYSNASAWQWVVSEVWK